MLWLSLSAYALHESNQLSVPYANQQDIIAMIQATQIPMQSSRQHSYTDEDWLIVSLLVSLTGLVILLRHLHHK